MHDVLSFCSLFVGEGATMASECVALGGPAIYINAIECSTCTEQEEKYGLLYNYRKFDGVLEKAYELLEKTNETALKEKSNAMIKEKVDVTKFMVWFLENFPKSCSLSKKKTDFDDTIV